MVAEQHLTLIVSGLSSLVLILFTFVLNGLRSDIKTVKIDTAEQIVKVDKRSEEIETNYNAKFDKVHEKLDIVIEKVAEQAGFCKAVQSNKKRITK